MSWIIWRNFLSVVGLTQAGVDDHLVFFFFFFWPERPGETIGQPGAAAALRGGGGITSARLDQARELSRPRQRQAAAAVRRNCGGEISRLKEANSLRRI
ncbi:hypothetical protein O9993_09990 [Vibrio lentus]|nr:hypothetical protein [Vibrio lentus]